MRLGLNTRLLDAALASRSLGDFAKLVWPILEPTTPMLWSWPQDLICEYLQAVSDGEILRLIINAPPMYRTALCLLLPCPVVCLKHAPNSRECPHGRPEGCLLRKRNPSGPTSLTAEFVRS